MSFHPIPAHLQPQSLQWLTRLVLPFVVGALLVTTSGCSMVMGIFGPTEADVTGAAAESPRLLVPTPVGRTAPSAAVATDPNLPTPTPFVMRPTAAEASTTEATVDAGADSKPQVQIAGDAVNIRNAPGLDSEVLLTAPRGATFDYVDQTPAGDWMQICCVNNQLAWVYGELAQITTDAELAQAEPIATVASASVASATVAENAAAPAATRRDSFNLADSLTELPGFTTHGSPTTFTAAEDGYAITLPAAWVPLAEADGVIEASIQAINEQNPALAALLEEQLNLIGDIPISLIAFDLAPETLRSGAATTLNVMAQPIPAGFPLNYVVQVSAGQLEQVLGLSAAAESTTIMLPAGEAVLLDYGRVEQTVTQQYYLMNEQTLYIVTFTAAATLADTAPELFAAVMQSFRFQ
jgi:hypothetical protein